jgi:hypothetical protein
LLAKPLAHLDSEAGKICDQISEGWMDAVPTGNKGASDGVRTDHNDPPREQREVGNRLRFAASFGRGFHVKDS